MRLEPSLLAAARQDAGLSLEQAGEAVSRSAEALRRYESGSLVPASPVLARMAKLYRRNVKDFYTEGGPDLVAARDAAIKARNATLTPLSPRQVQRAAVILSEGNAKLGNMAAQRYRHSKHGNRSGDRA